MWRHGRNRLTLRKGIANRIHSAIPFRNARAPGNSAVTGSLRNRSFVQDVVYSDPFPSWSKDFRSVLAVKGSLRRFAPLDRSGPIRRGWLFTREKGGWAGLAGPKGTFRPYQRLEPQRRGGVTRRAVAKRLDPRLCGGYPGFWLLVSPRSILSIVVVAPTTWSCPAFTDTFPFGG